MSFLDHFTGAALDTSKWTAITQNGGVVSVTDGYVSLDTSAGTTRAAAIYYNQQLNLGVSQLWWMAIRWSSLSMNAIQIINKATAPATDTLSNFRANTVIEVAGRNGNALEFRYFDSGGTLQRWNHGSSVWQTTGVDSLGSIVATDDYVLFGLEIDADNGNSRFRMMAAHKTVSSGYTVDQGLRIFALTDWVDWSDARSQADGLWLVIGDPFSNSQSLETRVEFVRHGDGARQYIYSNAKDAFSGNYGIRTSWGYDGQLFVPRDRTTVDASDVKDPWVVDDGAGTFHMFYRTMDTSPDAQIRRATASSKEGPWTEQDTLASPGANHTFHFPHVVYTPWETSGREWQALVTDYDASTGTTVQKIRLFTADAPDGTWTDQGVVIDVGSGGDADATGCEGGLILHRNGQYEVWYTGNSTVGSFNFVKQSGLRATGPALDNLTKDGAGARLTTQDQTELIDANLSGNTVTISDTTGFHADQLVYFNQDSTPDNWSGSRVRKVTTNTSLELYHRIMGFTTANGAKVFGARAGNQQIRDIVQVGSEWWVHLTTFNHSKLDPDGLLAFQEESSLLIVPSGTDLTDMAPAHYSEIDSPTVMRGSWSNIRSNENVSLVHGETAQSTASGGGFMPQMWRSAFGRDPYAGRPVVSRRRRRRSA